MSYHTIESLLSGSIRSLSHTPRYATFRLNRTENVAEHSFYTSFYTLAIIEYLRENHSDWFQESSREGGLKLYDLLAKSLCHDLEERVSGDIISTFKKRGSTFEELITNQAFEISRRVFKEEEVPSKIEEYCETAKDPYRIIETSIISLADYMCIGSTLLEEYEFSGNMQAHNCLVKKYIPFLKHCVERLEEKEVPEPIVRMYKNVMKVIRKRCSFQEVNTDVYTGYMANE